MRWLFATLACLLMLTVAAWAASAYDDVPTDHWAYNALDYLTERGVLEGYPDGFFKGDRTLTRYEFAQAIARLLDTIQTGNWDEQIKIMAETLRAEFSDQLAEISRQVNELGTKVQDLDTKVGDLQGQVDDQGSKLSDLAGKVAGLKPGPEWKGSFRYRWQFDQWGNSPNNYNRFRQRIAFQLGYNKKINDAVEIGFRLKTGTGAVATDGNHTLGNYGATANIYLDRAYVKYTPSWFGFYTDANCECQPKLDIYAGLFPNVTYDPHEMVLDADVNLQGVGAVYHFNQDFQILAASSVAVSDPSYTNYFTDDTTLFACEAKHNNLFMCGLDAWVGMFCWAHEGDDYPYGDPRRTTADGVPGLAFDANGYPTGFFDGNMMQFDFNGDGYVNGLDRFTPDFTTVKGGLQYTFDCVFNKPLAVFGEYMVNVNSDAETRIKAVNTFLSPTTPIIYDSTDDTGYVFGAQLGEEPKCVGQWYAFARYKEIGANAIISGFGDADAGGANINSLEVNWTYMWADNSLLGITYFLNKMHNAFGFTIPSNLADRSIVQVDWTFRF